MVLAQYERGQNIRLLIIKNIFNLFIMFSVNNANKVIINIQILVIKTLTYFMVSH